LTESQLLEKCAQHALLPGADKNTPIQQRYFQIFWDPAYGVSPVMLSPFSGLGERTEDKVAWNMAMAVAWNAAMVAVYIEVEHGFGDITFINTWPFLNAWWKLCLYSLPVGRYYHVAVLLSNTLNCICPNQSAQYFDCEPPILEAYFHA
ncbi:hypothetical protein B0H10DRAFT_1722562, partial [Mycena sp. CBHHK59/15]